MTTTQRLDGDLKPSSPQVGGLPTYKWPCLALIVLLLVLAKFRPLALPDEGRYAEIGRWMGISGDWLAPRLNGLPFFHKPPLLYWLEAFVTQVVGPGAWSIRLIPALHAAIVLVLMGPLLKRTLGPIIARRSVIIFGTSAAFLLGGQYINHDMMVACWISVAISSFASFALGGEVDLRYRAWIGFAACALGVLSKGLIGIVLPAWVLFLWLCWSGRWGALKRVPWISGLIIFFSLTLPWFLLTEHAYPGMLDYMFGVHQFDRFTGTQFNNAQPFWFYGAAISLLMGPWMIWFWAYQVKSMFDSCKDDGHRGFRAKAALLFSQFVPSYQATRTINQQIVGLCVIWVWAIVIFFSIPNSKIIGYALPVTPPMAVLCAIGWERMVTWRYKRYLWQIFLAVSIVLMVGINYKAAKLTRLQFSEDIAKVLICQNLLNAQLMVVGEYPYDLPFLLSMSRPMWVLQDWEFERVHAGDNWRRELFEGANFDPSKGDYLKPLSTIDTEVSHEDRWLLAPSHWDKVGLVKGSGYNLVIAGSAWDLYRTPATKFNPTNTDGSCINSVQ